MEENGWTKSISIPISLVFALIIIIFFCGIVACSLSNVDAITPSLISGKILILTLFTALTSEMQKCPIAQASEGFIQKKAALLQTIPLCDLKHRRAQDKFIYC